MRVTFLVYYIDERDHILTSVVKHKLKNKDQLYDFCYKVSQDGIIIPEENLFIPPSRILKIIFESEDKNGK